MKSTNYRQKRREDMGLFGGAKKDDGAKANEAKARELLDKYQNKELNDADFLKEFGKLVIYYTTPVGDTKDGKQKFFLIPGPAPTAYMPVFLNESELAEFYDKAGRAGLIILRGTLLNVIDVGISQNKKDDMNFQYGFMIDPWKYKLTLDAPVLETVRALIMG